MSGRLISLEGGEGAGKSTVMAALVAHLRASGIDMVHTREPGGTSVGESIRTLLLDPERGELSAHSELLLMFASRAQLMTELIEPALARGAWVLCDRFTDASFAYQGGGRGLDQALIAELERCTVRRRPDLVLLLDLPVQAGLARARARGGKADRIEREPDLFFERVREVYRARAQSEPLRWRVIDAARGPNEVAALAVDALDRYLCEQLPSYRTLP